MTTITVPGVSFNGKPLNRFRAVPASTYQHERQRQARTREERRTMLAQLESWGQNPAFFVLHFGKNPTTLTQEERMLGIQYAIHLHDESMVRKGRLDMVFDPPNVADGLDAFQSWLREQFA